MMSSNCHSALDRASGSVSLRTWSAPRLVAFGSVAELTAAGSGGLPEGRNFGQCKQGTSPTQRAC